jgi:enoyl-CoA hydratase/carnithine racemase
MSTGPVLRYEKRDRKAYLTMNRPEVMNAMNNALKDALDQAVLDLEADDDILVAILIGEGGRAFSAGADLKEMAQLDSEGSAGRFANFYMSDPLANCTKPVIAAIDGHCVAAGLETALRCDIRIATEKSNFGLPEPRRSLLAGYGLHHLSRTVPLGEALLMQLTGSPITARRAYEIGLIQKIAPDRASMLAEVEKVADDICLCAPLAVQAIKKIVKTGRNLPEEYSEKFAKPIEKVIYASEDRVEGPKAFAEKRKPNWKMR